TWPASTAIAPARSAPPRSWRETQLPAAARFVGDSRVVDVVLAGTDALPRDVHLVAARRNGQAVLRVASTRVQAAVDPRPELLAPAHAVGQRQVVEVSVRSPGRDPADEHLASVRRERDVVAVVGRVPTPVPHCGPAHGAGGRVDSG